MKPLAAISIHHAPQLYQLCGLSVLSFTILCDSYQLTHTYSPSSWLHLLWTLAYLGAEIPRSLQLCYFSSVGQRDRQSVLVLLYQGR